MVATKFVDGDYDTVSSGGQSTRPGEAHNGQLAAWDGRRRSTDNSDGVGAELYEIKETRADANTTGANSGVVRADGPPAWKTALVEPHPVVEGGACEWLRDGAGRHHVLLPLDGSQLRGRCRALALGGARVGRGRYTIPRHGLFSLPTYSGRRAFRAGELVVCSVPKCGTTWTLEMAWLVANDCDLVGARSPLDQNRYTEVGNLLYLGLTPAFLREYVPLVLTQPAKMNGLCRLLYLMARASFRSAGLVKTHVPLSLLPPDLLETNKVIYVTRNPKDALVSYFHHFSRCRVVHYSGTLDDLAQDYMAGLLPGLPFFSHVLEAWEKRHHPNMLFLFYEDMKRDMGGTLRRVAEFLGKTLTEAQVAQLCDHLSFDNMKNNEHANSLRYQDAGILDMPSFIRQGQVGSWKQHVTEETDRQLNEWITRCTKGTSLRFDGID